MASRAGPIGRSTSGCLGIFLLGVFIAAGGGKTSLIVGLLMTLGGLAMMGDGRRDPFTGFGSMMFGLILCVVGAIQFASEDNPAPDPASSPQRASHARNPSVASPAPSTKPDPNSTPQVVSSPAPPDDVAMPETAGEALEAEEAGLAQERQTAHDLAVKEELNRLKSKLQQILKLGTSVEPVNPEAAAGYYQEILDNDTDPSSDLPEVKEAARRLKLLQRKGGRR